MDQTSNILSSTIDVFTHAYKHLLRVSVYLTHERYMVTSFMRVLLVNTYLIAVSTCFNSFYLEKLHTASAQTIRGR